VIVISESSVLIADESHFSVLKEFKDNVEYELDLSVNGFFKQPASATADRDDALFLGRFTMQSQASLMSNLLAGFNVYGAYSSQKDEYNGAFREPGQRSRTPRYVDFNTAWLRYDADDYSVTIGKDYIDSGLSELYSPVDRFGLSNISNPTMPYKMGVWQASFDYFIADDSLSFTLVPIHEKSQIPPLSSRWIGSSNDPQFTYLAANTQIQEHYYPVRLENMGYLLKYKGARAGYDFFTLAHHGPAFYPALLKTSTPNVYNKIEPLAFSVAAGVLKVYEQWTFSLEAIYQQTYDQKDADFIRYSAGVSYKFNQLAQIIDFNDVSLSVQWSGDETVSEESQQLVAFSSREARPFRNTVFVKSEFEQNDKWSYYAMGVHNIESDYILSAGTKFKLNDNLIFNLEGSYFNGPEDTHFGRWSENDFIRLRTIYKF